MYKIMNFGSDFVTTETLVELKVTLLCRGNKSGLSERGVNVCQDIFPQNEQEQLA